MAVAKYKDSNGVVKTLPSVKVNLLDGLKGKVLISTENATLSSSVDSSVNGKSRALVKEGTFVWVNADKKEGLYFNYFKNQRDEIVSYSQNYNTLMNTDERLIPVYSDSEVEKKPLTFFNGNGYIKDIETSTLNFIFSSDIPENIEKKSWGILLSTKNLSDEDIVVGGNCTNKIISEGSTVKNITMVYSYTNSTIFRNNKNVKARAYSIIEKDGVEEIVYSDVITVQL